MAALNGMPFLVFNLGGEMLYILQQRLHAQNVAEDKSKKVLHDVISAMFAPAFITDLMRPQALYTNTSTRQVFDKLAHSSIMKLNTSSMDKLYDLMTMGFKQQVLSAARATDLFQITLNHLDSVREMIHSSAVAQLLTTAHERFVATFKDLTVGQYLIIKQTLCNWFQDRRVKVSLFLSTGLQNTDGTMVLSHKGALPEGSESPGLVRYFSDGRLLGTANIQLCNSEGVTPAVPREAYEVLDFEQRPCKLGRNLYGKDRKPKESSSGPPPAQPADVPEERSATDAARSEISLLASLVRAPSVKSDEVFSITNLFPDSSSDSKSSEPLSDFISFESEGYERRAAQIIEKLKGFSIEQTVPLQGDAAGDDLLDLMDGQT